MFKFWALVPKPKLPKPAAIVISGILVISFAIASGFFIQWVRGETRQTIPCIQSQQVFPGSIGAIDLIMVKGPAMQAAPFEAERTEFMGKQFQALTASAKTNKLLGYLGLGQNDTVLVFLTPGDNWHDQAERHDSNRVDLFILVLNSPVKYNGANFSQFRRAWTIRQVISVGDFSYQAFKDGKDPAQGEVKIPGPPGGGIQEFQRVKFEERVDFFLSGL